MASDLPRSVTLREVGPREGVQTLGRPVSTADKVQMIESLASCGLTEIEMGAFVNPRVMPMFADSGEVARRLKPFPGVAYRAVYFTASGAREALQAGGLEIDGFVSVSPSDAFMRRVVNRSTGEVLDGIPAYSTEMSELGLEVRSVGVMAAFGCNYAGDIAASRAVDVVQRTVAALADCGHTVREVTLADTMGWATPVGVTTLVGECRTRWPEMDFRLHLHDTRGTGLANAYAGLHLGVHLFESSIAGVGGCPFTGAGAAGNIVTEDLAHMCEEMGIETGLDLDRLVEVSHDVAERLSVDSKGRVAVALPLGSLRKQLRP